MQVRSRVGMLIVVVGLLAGGAVRAVATNGEPSSPRSVSPVPAEDSPAPPASDGVGPTSTQAAAAPAGGTAPPARPAPPSPSSTTTRAPSTGAAPGHAVAAPTTAPVERPATTTTRPAARPPAPSAGNTAGNTAGDALAALNRDRAAQGLPALAVRADLQAKAQAWADRLAAEQTIYHSNLSDGLSTCWTGLGENISPSGTVALAEQQLMNDPPHRANILNPKWNWVGLGVARTSTGVMVVQDFMSGCS